MTRRYPLVLAALVAFAAVLAPLASYAWQSQSIAMGDSSYLQLLHWRMVGPSRGGRVTAVAGDPVDKLVFYFGATGGGIWKTDDGGIHWRNVSDGFVSTGSVGALAVAPSNPNIVFAGMGEACVRGDASYGDGVYKSTDGGKTWTNVGLKTTRSIARVRIHPQNPDLVYVAVLGDPWGPSPDRGVYRSKDGGRTWEKILYRSEQAGAIDLVMNPKNPNVMYASTLEERRYPWGFRSAGPGTALYKTTDGGDHWTELTNKPGLPTGVKGRIGIALAPSRPERVWAIVDAELGKKGVYRSDDAGQTWRHLTDNAELTMRPWYYHHIFADPKNPDVIYVLNVGAWKSTDGGEKFQPFRPPHGDHHDLWIDPDDPQRMIEGNDGGATVSYNGGLSWSTILNQPTAQIYHVAADHQFPYHIYGAQQDNTTIGLPSRSDFGRITIEDWETVGGGEDGYIATNLNNSDVIYAANHHWLTRYDRRTKQTRDISPNPETHYGWGAADINFRFWWTYPVITSPTKPNTLYVTSQYVHRSTDEGQSWQIVSPDLTRHDPKTLEHTPFYGQEEETQPYWGPITREAYGPEWYATIFAFAESPQDSNVLWAGSDDGYVQVSRDSGKNWTRVTPPDLPQFALISIIEPSPHNAAEAYVAATRYKLQDDRPYLYKTTDYGKTWTTIVRGIPDNDFTRVIREDPERPGLLFAGTETGVYVSFDDGARWQPIKAGLPVVPVHDLIIKEGDLVAATHGRGFWILDGEELLRQFDVTSLNTPVHLFAPRTTVRFRQNAELAAGAANIPSGSGANPPSGVSIPFYLKEAPSGPVYLKILRERSGASEEVRTFLLTTSGQTGGGRNVERAERGEDDDDEGGGRRAPASGPLRAIKGANTFVWDLRYAPPKVLPGAVFQGRATGPIAAPGTYRVELTVAGQTYAHSFKLVKDPRIPYTDSDLEEQFQFMKRVSDRLEQTMKTVKRIRDMRKQAKDMFAQAKKEGRSTADLESAIKALNDKLYPIEERLVQFRARAGEDLINYPTGFDSKLARLLDFSSMADAPPTEGEKELYGRLTEGVTDRMRLVDQVERTEYATVVRLAVAH
jgi:photosystem II stability/assembly factor-like uncharacterized protein